MQAERSVLLSGFRILLFLQKSSFDLDRQFRGLVPRNKGKYYMKIHTQSILYFLSLTKIRRHIEGRTQTGISINYQKTPCHIFMKKTHLGGKKGEMYFSISYKYEQRSPDDRNRILTSVPFTHPYCCLFSGFSTEKKLCL